jgi:hypothetical protein
LLVEDFLSGMLKQRRQERISLGIPEIKDAAGPAATGSVVHIHRRTIAF